jgi:hypothetical protein
MSDKPVSDLRRMLEDMAVRRFGEKTRHDCRSVTSTPSAC